MTDTAVINTETMSNLLRKTAALGLTKPITPVPGNARYHHDAAVKAFARHLATADEVRLRSG